MNVTVNILELASELTDLKVRIQYGENRYKKDSEGTLIYTEQAQDLFNNWYDIYYTLIEKLKS
jgi:hypothetical protein